MKTATVVLNLTKEGHYVTLAGVTPAELLLLVAEHHANAGGKPVVELKPDATEVKREANEEVSRLMSKYAANKVFKLFPGATPTLPTDFKQAEELGVKTVLPTSKLTEVRIA